MEIKLSTLPLWAISFFGLAAACLLPIYWNSHWKRYARSFFRVAVFVSLTSIAQAVLMSVHTGTQAQSVYSIFLPLVFFEQVSVIESFIVTFDLRRPRWFAWLWVLGLAFIVCSMAFYTRLYPVFQPVPDGYLFSTPSNAWTFIILKSLVYGVNLVALITVVVRGLQRQVDRRRWPYALSVLILGVCFVNDSILIQHQRTLYPTTWIAAIIYFGMLWREVRWHMREVYDRLDYDNLTGAYSRRFGELYLAELMQDHSVGLIYADIDNFKDVNDAFGHQAGDRALRLFADLVKPLMGMPNALVRLGGDEFLFIFPDANPDDEDTFRNSIHVLLDERLCVKSEDRAVTTPLCVSLGWAHAKKGSSWTGLVHDADLSMYQKKNA